MAELVGHPGEHPAGVRQGQRGGLCSYYYCLNQFALVEICVPPVADTHVLLPTYSGRGALAARDNSFFPRGDKNDVQIWSGWIAFLRIVIAL
jgi:hypothetical protein